MAVVAVVRDASPGRDVRKAAERLLSYFQKPEWPADRPVMVKVNCLCRSKPEEGYDVHPEVVLAVARKFRSALSRSNHKNRGDQVFHVLPLALWAARLLLPMFAHPHRQRELAPAFLAFVFVSRHMLILSLGCGS